MSKPLTLTLQDLKDRYIRQNFEKIRDYLKARELDVGPPGFQFITQTFDGAETHFKIPHGLGIVPLDLIQTSKTGTGVVTWNYDLFDAQFLDISVTAACVIRAYIGTNRESV